MPRTEMLQSTNSKRVLTKQPDAPGSAERDPNDGFGEPHGALPYLLLGKDRAG